MTLLITIYRRDLHTKKIIEDIFLENSKGMAGFESWRHTVYHEECLKYDAKFLPRLKQEDLYVENENLIDFQQECLMLLDKFEDEQIKFRLTNMIEAICIAIENNAGILIN